MRLSKGQYHHEFTGEYEPSVILDEVDVGEGVVVHAFVNAYRCKIGADTQIGTFVEIQKGVVVGERCKIQSHTFICEGVTIEDECFIGHGVLFTNDDFPRACNKDGSSQAAADWTLLPTRICRGASIGSGAIIRGGVVIGGHAMVGAGAVVTRDVSPWTVVVGVPARMLRRIQRSE